MSRSLILAATLLALPAFAEDVQFKGHTLDVDASQEARNIRGMSGALYGVRGSPEQVIEKAQGCVAGVQGYAVVAVDAAAGRLEADGRFNYRKGWTTRSLRSRLLVEASPAQFRIAQSALGQAPLAAAEATDADYAPISQEQGGWEDALDVLIPHEQGIVDCMYR